MGLSNEKGDEHKPIPFCLLPRLGVEQSGYVQYAYAKFRSSTEQLCTFSNSPHVYSLRMKDEIRLLAVELDSHDGLIATFSDGTSSGYVIEELLKLRPHRERVRAKKKIPNVRRVKAQP
jgi:hypothetical protein